MKLPRISRPDISLRDVHVYVGLGVASWGGWQLAPAWTLVGLGACLTAMGLFLARRRAP